MDPAEDWLFIQRQRHNTNMRSLHASNWADAQSEYPPEQPPPGYGWNNDFRQNQQYVGEQGSYLRSATHREEEAGRADMECRRPMATR